MRLQDEREHPHGLSDREFDALFTADRPVVFAYHGYPWLIHRLTYRRTQPRQHPRARLQGGGHDHDAVRHGDAQRPRPLPPRHGRDRPRARARLRAARACASRWSTRRSAARYTREHGRRSRRVRDWAWPLYTASDAVLVVNAGSSSLKLRLLGPTTTTCWRVRRTWAPTRTGSTRRWRRSGPAGVDAVGSPDRSRRRALQRPVAVDDDGDRDAARA